MGVSVTAPPRRPQTAVMIPQTGKRRHFTSKCTQNFRVFPKAIIAARDEIAAVKTQLDSVNLTIKEVLPDTAKATPLAQALTQLLRRHSGLTLVRTSAVAPEVSSIKPGQAAGAVAPPVGLTRQGIELTVSGTYPDLMRYVQTLESEMPQVRWGVMQLKSDKLPPQLTLQLFLLEVQP